MTGLIEANFDSVMDGSADMPDVLDQALDSQTNDQQPQEQQPDGEPQDQQQPQEQPAEDDWKREATETMRVIRQQAQAQAQAQVQAQQQPQQQNYVPPTERPENIQKLAELLEQAAYDPNARNEYLRLSNQIQREQTEYMLEQQRQEFQQQQQFQYQAPQLMAQTFQQIQQQQGYGANVQREDFDAVVSEVFGGDPAAIARALNPSNPNASTLHRILGDAALGRAARTGRLNQQRTAPTPPANPRSPARNAAPTVPTTPPANKWEDRKAVDNLMERIYDDPTQFLKGNKQ